MKSIMKIVFIGLAFILAANVAEAGGPFGPTDQTGYYGCPLDDDYEDCVARQHWESYEQSQTEQHKKKSLNQAKVSIYKLALTCTGIYWTMEEVHRTIGNVEASQYAEASKNQMYQIGSEMLDDVMDSATRAKGYTGSSLMLEKFNEEFQTFRILADKIIAKDKAKTDLVLGWVNDKCLRLLEDPDRELKSYESFYINRNQ